MLNKQNKIKYGWIQRKFDLSDENLAKILDFAGGYDDCILLVAKAYEQTDKDKMVSMLHEASQITIKRQEKAKAKIQNYLKASEEKEILDRNVVGIVQGRLAQEIEDKNMKRMYLSLGIPLYEPEDNLDKEEDVDDFDGNNEDIEEEDEDDEGEGMYAK